jgi:hypothetical protein
VEDEFFQPEIRSQEDEVAEDLNTGRKRNRNLGLSESTDQKNKESDNIDVQDQKIYRKKSQAVVNSKT